MPKPNKFISIPMKRPLRCVECPLLGIIPKDLLRHGERFTLRCFLTGHEREISGRGAKAIDKRHRATCSDGDYNKAFATYAGEIEVSEQDYYMYQLDKSSWLYERDKRHEAEETIRG